MLRKFNQPSCFYKGCPTAFCKHTDKTVEFFQLIVPFSYKLHQSFSVRYSCPGIFFHKSLSKKAHHTRLIFQPISLEPTLCGPHIIMKNFHGIMKTCNHLRRNMLCALKHFFQILYQRFLSAQNRAAAIVRN